eukprot:tig00020519_g9970.t1
MPPKSKSVQTLLGKGADGNISFQRQPEAAARSSSSPPPSEGDGGDTSAAARADFRPMAEELWVVKMRRLPSWVWKRGKAIQGYRGVSSEPNAAMCLLDHPQRKGERCGAVFNIKASTNLSNHFNNYHGIYEESEPSAQHADGQSTLGPAFQKEEPYDRDENLAKHYDAP